jgi:APA family basic amino acid/polyamine antiporter
LYLVINVAFLRVLPMPDLAASTLPAADAARIVLPSGGATFVTMIALLTMLSLLNNTLLVAPRILFGISRDGWLTERAALVSAGGTPRVALLFTSVFVVLVILSGSFEQIIALYAVLFLVCYVSAFLAVFALRRSEPSLARPYRALGYPFSTAVVLLGSVVFLVAAVAEDHRSGLTAAVFIASCVPAYALLSRRRRLRLASTPA